MSNSIPQGGAKSQGFSKNEKRLFPKGDISSIISAVRILFLFDHI
jgi:hypothetical protein